ncbi:MAG TPA: Zn-dependent hydrolase [Gammaproteobacteria bacterium]|nr:Zn-dependent hydrolase [Gammaproteobacteria bacterium]HPI96708.1 Zn-dependent hydrolase [Gammaproteobacteria bacterium]HPQ88090.1 Zn-dependent hydrolase [Gammaproteobacteria bacterium]
MMMKNILILLTFTALFSCSKENATSESKQSVENHKPKIVEPVSEPATVEEVKNAQEISQLEDIYAEFTLTSDLSHLNDNQKKMIPILVEISQIMDELFWLQSYGNKDELLNSIDDSNLKGLADINYGPWDRLNGDKSFIKSYGEKPLGANFYPHDMTKEEFESSNDPEKSGLYTIVERNDKGELVSRPYHDVYSEQLIKASKLLIKASELAEDQGFKDYLALRATALMTSQYFESDMAWMDMKSNDIDFVVGPIENYEDQLYNYKTAFEAYVLIKDKSWSEKLSKFAKLLPVLQEGLPVDEAYKTESPGTDSDLNAYDALYYAGHSNAGSKTIAINLPNDEKVQLAKGSRRLQLKNAMKAKFDKILVPISEVLVAPEQRKHITFDAFFGNTMFHEVAHGLGIKNTINGKGTVRTALKQHASAQEEGKADILGLYMVEKLYEMGEITEGEVMDNYVTFMAGIFRSVRFGSSSAHGVANMLRFNYFAEQQAFNFDEESGYYSVNPEKMSQAIQSLSNKILTLQGNGDYEGVEKWVHEQGKVSPELEKALSRLQNIPVDIVFKQGVEYLNL